MNVFDVFDKMTNLLGLQQFSFATTFTDDKISEGFELLSKARQLKEKLYLSDPQMYSFMKRGYKARYRTRVYGDDDLYYDEEEFKNSYQL